MGYGKNEAKTEKIRVCFLGPSLDVCGGVQRVMAVVANGCSNRYEVSVLSINNYSKNSYYYLNPQIEQICFNDFLFRKWDILSAVIRKFVRKYPVVLPASWAQNVFFPDYICKRIGKLLREKKYDCIIASTGDCIMLLGVLKKYLPNTRLIGWQHNTYNIHYEIPGKGNYVHYKLMKEVLSKLDCLVTLTRNDVNEYKTKMDIDCKYIYNPLSFESQQKSSVENKTIVFVGRLSVEQKGLDYLLQIMRILFKERGYTDWNLQIIGDGEGYSWIEEQIKKESLESQIQLLGEKKDVIPYYCNSSIFVCTSRWEGFGLVVTEAMECGLPVVSFATEGPSEIVKDHENGFLVDKYSLEQFADAVEILMKDETLRKKFSQNAIQRAKAFYLDAILDKWEQVIRG